MEFTVDSSLFLSVEKCVASLKPPWSLEASNAIQGRAPNGTQDHSSLAVFRTLSSFHFNIEMYYIHFFGFYVEFP